MKKRIIWQELSVSAQDAGDKFLVQNFSMPTYRAALHDADAPDDNAIQRSTDRTHGERMQFLQMQHACRRPQTQIEYSKMTKRRNNRAVAALN